MCHQLKPLSEFTNDKGTPDGLKYGCRPCLTKQKRENRHRNPQPARDAARRWRLKNPDKLAGYGKKYREKISKDPVKQAQRRARYQKWANSNPERVKSLALKNHLKNKYSLTVLDHAQLLKTSKGVCAICGKPPARNRRLAIDHCHATGKVRGLLCHKCNSAIGLLGDSLELVRSAATYLSQ